MTVYVRRLLWLLRSYTAPYWYLVALLIVTSYLATAVAALFPLLMAPILDLALGGANGLGGGDAASGLSLRNLGASVLRWIGVTAVDDRARAILVLCAVYIGVGFFKGRLCGVDGTDVVIEGDDRKTHRVALGLITRANLEVEF